MKKIMLATMALSLITAKVFAEPIPEDKLASYKNAVKLAIPQDMNCTATSKYNGSIIDSLLMTAVLREIDFANVGDINQTNEQPLIKFSRRSSSSLYNIYVSTTSDYLSVSKIVKEEYDITNVNSGTIKNPEIKLQPKNTPELITVCEPKK